MNVPLIPVKKGQYASTAGEASFACHKTEMNVSTLHVQMAPHV